MRINSVTIFVPAQYRSEVNILGQQLGYGADTWSVPLSASGAGQPTHYGTHLWETPGGNFNQLRLAVQSGIIPPGLEAHEQALSSLIIYAVENSTDGFQNWTQGLASSGLRVIE